MACGRQLWDGFYAKVSDAHPGPTKNELTSLLDNLLLDFERRLTTNIFDVNRTVTALSSEVRRSVAVENIPVLLFERALRERMGGRSTTVRTVEELVKIVPSHALVRQHYSGDFCLCLPLLCCTNNIPYSSLKDLPQEPFSPQFSAQKQEVFVAIQRSPLSPHFLEVFSPFPGEGPGIDTSHYPTMRLSCEGAFFNFPPGRSTDDDDEEEDGPGLVVELKNVRKGDGDAAAKPGELTVGDVLLVRRRRHHVTSVTGGGMPCEVYGGADLILVDPPFSFNARRVRGRVCLPVLIRAKHGFLPASSLANHEPISMKFSSTGAAKQLGMGTFSFSFSSLAFYKELVCHRYSVLPPAL